MGEPLQDTQPQETTKVYGTVPRENIEMHGETLGRHMERGRNDTHATGTRQRACVAVSHTWPLTQQGQATAHPEKSIETHMCVDEDGGQRQRTRRESDMHAMVPDAAQP